MKLATLAFTALYASTCAAAAAEDGQSCLREQTGNEYLRAALDDQSKDYTAVFRQAIIRPLKLMALSPVLNLVSFWAALAYGYTYILLTSLAPVYEEVYGFPPNFLGLTYIGIGVGTLIGMAVYSATSDRYSMRKSAEANTAARGNGQSEDSFKSEYRLFLLPLSTLLLPAGMFLYGWPAQYGVHWMVPPIGTAIVGIALNILVVSTMTYLIDVFKTYAASALAASTVWRSLAGGLLPMVSLPLYNSLGLGWGNSLLAFIALGLAPTSLLILKYGEFLRKKYDIKHL